MYFLTILLLILVIAMVLSIIGLQTSILIKDLAVKRYSILTFILMILASIVSRIISAKTQSFSLGLISGPLIILFGFLPVIYSGYLRKKQTASYTGIWKCIGDWMDSPIKTLFLKK
ncbi:MAG: hypothetical protein ABFD18_01280 [Syntrophomonas sp.]